MLAVLGAVVLFKALTFESEGGDPIGAFAWRPLSSSSCRSPCLARCWTAGLALAVPVLIAVVSLACESFRWKSVLVNALVLTAGAWAVAVWGLKLAIPVWPMFLR